MRLHCLSFAAVVAGLAACGESPVAVGPEVQSAPPMVNRALSAHASAMKGLYAAEFYGSIILGYKSNNPKDKPPVCTVPGVSYVNGIAVDGKGNLIDPDGGSLTIKIFQGPGMCGALAATIADPYGWPDDATSPDALTGTIVVANWFDGTQSKQLPGSLSLCTVNKGCTVNLTNSQMNFVAGVAQARNGDCWASSLNASSEAKLIYFKGCSGKGSVASHFLNSSWGGLDIDNHGNLVAVSEGGSLYVYKGCNPSCALVGGPFVLRGTPFPVRLNESSTKLAIGNSGYSTVDVYSYRPTNVQYLYSFQNGLSSSADVTGVAFNPRSKE